MQLLKTDDGSYTLHNPELQESYHSKFGALTESDQVYLRNSGVLARLKNQQATSILEIGFGTGFNFVHTAKHALQFNCPLRYTACELHPLPKNSVLEVLTHNAPDAPMLCNFAADAIDQLSASATVASTFNHQTSLHLLHTDATSHTWPRSAYDAIYLDAFSIRNNPSLWRPDFLLQLRTAAKDNATLASYCVTGKFRAALEEAGFTWQKLPGPKGKREVLVATALGTTSQSV